MDVTGAAGFLRYFNDLPDRRAGNKIHQFHDLIVIAVMAVRHAILLDRGVGFPP